MAFSQKILAITFVLNPAGETKAFDNGTNILTLSGLRAHVEIQVGGGGTQGQAHCRVFGMTQSHMNALSAQTMQITASANKNTVSIAAGDAAGIATVFTGQIMESWIDASNEPEVCLIVAANAGALGAATPIAVNSYAGPVDLAVILGTLAQAQGWAFEDNGISRMLRRVYLHGDVLQQIKDAVLAAHDIDWFLDPNTAPPTLAIFPLGGARGGTTTIPLISPATGMSRSPQFNGAGLNVTMLFNPLIRLAQWVEVQSQVKAACGKFIVNGVWHSLDSETPGGQWFTTAAVSLSANMTPQVG